MLQEPYADAIKSWERVIHDNATRIAYQLINEEIHGVRLVANIHVNEAGEWIYDLYIVPGICNA